MFLKLNHQKLEVCHVLGKIVNECYKLAQLLPKNEGFGILSQMQQSAFPVHLNDAEGAAGKSEAEQKRYDAFAGGLVIEIDVAPGIDSGHEYLKRMNPESPGTSIINLFHNVNRVN